MSNNRPSAPTSTPTPGTFQKGYQPQPTTVGYPSNPQGGHQPTTGQGAPSNPPNQGTSSALKKQLGFGSTGARCRARMQALRCRRHEIRGKAAPLCYRFRMVPMKQTAKKTRGFVLGRGRFEKISAVEGIKKAQNPAECSTSSIARG